MGECWTVRWVRCQRVTRWKLATHNMLRSIMDMDQCRLNWETNILRRWVCIASCNTQFKAHFVMMLILYIFIRDKIIDIIFSILLVLLWKWKLECYYNPRYMTKSMRKWKLKCYYNLNTWTNQLVLLIEFLKL